MKLQVRDILKATGGILLKGSEADWVQGVSTDTRTLKEGNLFFALHGLQHDGHDYLDQAGRQGVSTAVVDRVSRVPVKNLIRVKDTLRALGDLAKAWRLRFPVPVVAITGSNGKTTTKDLTAALLSTQYKTLKTEGNFNNLIGLPLTLFKLNREIEMVVLEMGMNRPGEIDRLADIAFPQVGVITNIGRAHLEGLGKIVDVVKAKAELLRRLPSGGLAVLNMDDPHFKNLKKRVRSSLKTFGQHVEATVRSVHSQTDNLKETVFDVKKDHFRMPLLGKHNLSNALAALVVADHFGISLVNKKKALSSIRGASMRMQVVVNRKGITILHDGYNANPDSTLAAVNFLKEAKSLRRKVVVLGDMLELGVASQKLHREIGKKISQAGVGLLIALGPHAVDVVAGARREGMKTSSSLIWNSQEDVQKAIPFIRENLKKGDLVLIKGSRGMKMERIVEALHAA